MFHVKKKNEHRIISMLMTIAMIFNFWICDYAITEVQAASLSTSQEGINLLKTVEGCVLTAYKPYNSEAYYTIAEPKNNGKDCVTMHYEMMGIAPNKPFETFNYESIEIYFEIKKKYNSSFINRFNYIYFNNINFIFYKNNRKVSYVIMFLSI